MTGKAELFSDSRCALGEGPFWHPLLGRLFWFDILNHTLLSAGDEGNIVDRITFKDTVSGAAVIDRDTLAVAQAGALLRYDFRTDTSTVIAEIEPDKPGNRTNDARTNPAGGFWIGTMLRVGDGRKGAGAVYQYRAGELATVLENVTTPNATCFSPDGRRAYFADTGTGVIRTCAIDPATGMPAGAWQDFAAPEAMGSPDGAVVDTEGYLWSARWNGSCVIRFAPDGSIDQVVELPVSRVTCPAFGGDDYRTLYVTSAREGMSDEELRREPHAGSVFAIDLDVPGFPDPAIRL
jgi:sugar lactone lactonase YvrE